ncbi:MAG: XRE family transcriptional regulator [Alphaproteobacteria bacterium]|nr:MAG: XRE family transcriptional regulator [Alphaproteobacteria bacterium]
MVADTHPSGRDLPELFRRRLSEAMAAAGLNRAQLARALGVDRSTVSQILAPEHDRLPSARVIAAAARALGVSADWLLGLSDRAERAGDVLDAAVGVTDAPRSPSDERILAWHAEARGYKIRHVPASLPEMLKTREVLVWEYGPHLGRTPEQAIRAAEDRLAFLTGGSSDHEIAMPESELRALAEGCGYYAGLPAAARRAQIARIRELHEAHYPRLRLHLFDPREIWSAPLTIFGPLLAAVYVGTAYLVFRDRRRVDALTAHFDRLVRAACVAERDLGPWLAALEARAAQDRR